MFFDRLIKKSRNPHGKIKTEKVKSTRVNEDFIRIIKRERARADRGGHQFVIIDFDLEKPKSKGASVESLLKLLSNRLRITDELGWINKSHIAVLLYNTSVNFANFFAASICDELSKTVAPLEYIVYKYPNNPLNSIEGDEDNCSGQKMDNSVYIQSPESLDEKIIHNEFYSCSKEIDDTSLNNIINDAGKISPFFETKIPLWKRCMDIIGSSIALIIFFPLCLLLGVLIKTVSQGPVLFKQERIGYGGKKFNFYKFRTMRVNADTFTHQNYLSNLINECSSNEESGQPMIKLDPNDSQIIPFGKFLRNTCLDELPQLINVLRGEMSLVGPRPPIPYEVEEYLRWHKCRFDVLPGMTGLWQVSGKNRLTFKEMVRLDIRYSQKLSFWMDVKILFKTPLVIINQFSVSEKEIKKMVNVAVVGCGYWGPNLIRNFNSLPECKVKYACDVDQERLSHMVAVYPGIKTATEIGEVIDDEEIDIVTIATPVRSHYEMAKKALLAGKHTFIEKPMASSVAECKELIDIAEEKNLTIFIGHTFIYSSPVRKIKEIINHRNFGEIQYISARRLNLGLFQKDINVAWDLAPHDISIILYVVGKSPIAVNCQGRANKTTEIEDVTNMTLSFDNGGFATIQSSWLDPNKIREMTFVGSKRMLVYNDMEPIEKIKIYDKRVEIPPHYDTFAEFHYSYHYGDMYSPYLKQQEPLKLECQHFLDCVRTGQRPQSCGYEGLQVVEILEAASKSISREGAKVNIGQSGLNKPPKLLKINSSHKSAKFLFN